MIVLAKKVKKSSFCSDNNQDLKVISKTLVDKSNSSFPFTKQNIDKKISEKCLIPRNYVTSSKSNSTTKITEDI